MAWSILFGMSADSYSINIKWKKKNDEKGVEVFAGKVAGENLVAFKGKAIINYPLEEVATVFYDEKNKKEWVDMVYRHRLIKKLAPGKTLVYNQTDLPWPVWNREFVYKMTVSHNKKTKGIEGVIKSVPNQFPQEEKTVRGELIFSGFILTPVNDQQTKVEVTILADPKGKLPYQLVNFLQSKWPVNTIQGLRKQLHKGITPHKDILTILSK